MSAFSSRLVAFVTLLTLWSSIRVEGAVVRQVAPESPVCSNLIERREWRALSTDEKTNYINAVHCLQSNPAVRPAITAARSRFDEFQALHMYLADGIHYVGHFFPWHRYFVMTYERALREECDYQGANPYWDWSIDSDKPESLATSEIFSAETGFGGNGVAGTYAPPPDPQGLSKIHPTAYKGCVYDGPFANLTLYLGPGKMVTEHCMSRGIDDTMKLVLNSTMISGAVAQPSFETFRLAMEAVQGATIHKPHDGGHVAVGGELSNFYSSPGDPLFYLHHSNLDRIWWTWQQADAARLLDISGPTTPDPPFTQSTLDFVLEMGELAPTVTIRDVMDTRAPSTCYTYI